MPKYKLAGPLHHNGKLYNSGEEVELTPEEANPLKAAGVLDNGKPKAAPAAGADAALAKWADELATLAQELDERKAALDEREKGLNERETALKTKEGDKGKG